MNIFEEDRQSVDTGNSDDESVDSFARKKRIDDPDSGRKVDIEQMMRKSDVDTTYLADWDNDDAGSVEEDREEEEEVVVGKRRKAWREANDGSRIHKRKLQAYYRSSK